MVWYYILLYAVIQGVTEFLPISSSGHLVLAHEWVNSHTGMDNAQDRWAEDAVIDIAVHVGTLLSVLLYFRHDFFKMTKSLACVKSEAGGSSRAMVLYIIIGSLPVILCGYLLHLWQPDWIRSPEIVAWTTLIFGFFLWMADRFSKHVKPIEQMTLGAAFLIGLSQVLALIPGTSRSGITMTSARALGYTREAAAKFSLFLSVIAISGAGVLAGRDVLLNGNSFLGTQSLIAVGVSFIAGYASISLMINWLKTHDFTPFVVYRALLGCVLILMLYL